MNVIKRAYEKTGTRVVILIDEYDKPMLRSMHDQELQIQYRNLLTAFYTVLKSADQWIHFIFITGVTKFAQMGIFSSLNQLVDISFDVPFADLCGLTRQEIEENFPEGLQALADNNHLSMDETMERLTEMYDGYHFSPRNMVHMYNPFSILQALTKKDFGHYWFSSGTPTFLIEMLKKTDYDLRKLEGDVYISEDALLNNQADSRNPVPMIYQSGYLTIKEYQKEFRTYTLGFPNEEVKFGLLNFMSAFYTGLTEGEAPFYIGHFVNELRGKQVDAFLTRMRAFFADFPYELNDKTERHYQVVFYLIFKLMGQYTRAEVQSARGRADAVVWTPEYIYVFEFKLNGTAQEALRQIDEKGYLIPYTADGRKVVKVGVSFDKEERNLGDWEVME